MVVDVRVKPGAREELVRTYHDLAQVASRQPGLIEHQLCESLDDPDRWLVVSEWETIEASTSWDRSDDHRRLLAPMRACFEQASRSAFEIRDGIDRRGARPGAVPS